MRANEMKPTIAGNKIDKPKWKRKEKNWIFYKKKKKSFLSLCPKNINGVNCHGNNVKNVTIPMKTYCLLETFS